MTTNQIEWTPYLATAYAEGFLEGEDATNQERLQAFGYLVKSGLAWSLQGATGRAAQYLIDKGFITKDGEVTELGLEQ